LAFGATRGRHRADALPDAAGEWRGGPGFQRHGRGHEWRLCASLKRRVQDDSAQFWTSEKTGAKYPVGWRIEVPRERLQLTIKPVLENQELALMPLTYWEGAIEITGTRDGKPIKGRGYLELTGYAGPLRELQR
jgi:hypothetical protein